MRDPRIRIRTLILAFVSAAVGLATAPRTYEVWPQAWTRNPVPAIHKCSLLEILAAASLIGAVVLAVLLGLAVIVPKMRVRHWMIAVALAGGSFGLYRHCRTMEELADRHAAMTEIMISVETSENDQIVRQTSEEDLERQRVKADWHAKLAEKYRQAAYRPWLLLEPDPPEPQ